LVVTSIFLETRYYSKKKKKENSNIKKIIHVYDTATWLRAPHKRRHV